MGLSSRLESLTINLCRRLKTKTQQSYKALRDALLPRPDHPKPPSFPVISLSGIYSNPGYGDLELCLVSPSVHTQHLSSSCQKLVSESKTTMPGVVDEASGVPTLIAKWDKLWTSHFKLVHYDHDLWNCTLFSSLASISFLL